MQKIKSFIEGADKNQSSPTITFSGLKSKGNIIGGLLGLACWVVLVILLIQKSSIVFSKQKVNVQSFRERSMKPFTVDTNKANFQIYAMKDTGKTQTIIKVSETNLYGFRIMYKKVWTDVTTVDAIVVPMVAGDSDQFTFVLPKQHQNLEMTCTMKQIDCGKLIESSIAVVACDIMQKNCTSKLSSDIVVWMLIQDNKFNVFNSNTAKMKSSQVGFYHFADMSLNTFSTYTMDIYFSKIQIETDESIAPSLLNAQDIVNTQGWFIQGQDRVIETRTSDVQIYFVLNLIRSDFTERYKRSFTKVDSMLGQILGFMGLITLIITLMCSNYNQFLMKEHIRGQKKQIQKKAKGQTISSKPKQKGFIDYVISIFKFREQNGEDTDVDILKMYEDIRIIKQFLGIDGVRSSNLSFDAIQEKSQSNTFVQNKLKQKLLKESEEEEEIKDN